ncbi:peptidylprolyl isomerase [Candidatus Woesearchaeota archaeon]|nr:peptidylprolyl isomerase [Candidatus Woesearchaeota archaeon]
MVKKKHEMHHVHHKTAAHHGKKKPMGQYIFGAVVLVVLVAVIAGLIYMASKSGESRLLRQKEIAAVVNDEQITMAYLDEQYDRVPEMYREFITKGVLLNQTINEVILLQEAKKQGIEVGEEDVTAEIESAMAQAGVSAEELDERLAEQNISREFLEELYTKQLTINALLDKVVFKDIDVTDEEIEGFYDSRIHAMHILVETEDEANDIIDGLKTVSRSKISSRFSEIATEKSIDPSAETNGGDLGEFGRGQMVPEFENAAFALEEYAFTAEPIQTQFGYHVILRLPKEAGLEEQYDAIKDFLLTQKKAQTVPLYLEQLRSKAKVEVFFEEGPAEE